MNHQDLSNRVYKLEHVEKDFNNRIIHISKQISELDDHYHNISERFSVLKTDVVAYTSQHGEAIRTLQEAVNALRELTAELKQESKLQEKSIESVIKQMTLMNDNMSKLTVTFNKFLYIGGGILMAVTLISDGTVGKVISVLSGGG